MAHDIDAAYKRAFTAPELVRDLLAGFVPEPFVHLLDFGTLQKVNCHYVTKKLRQRTADIVWRLKSRSSMQHLYVLIEFQSTVDRFMASRMLGYVNQLYDDLVRSRAVARGGTFSSVLPIVLYNGNTRWTAAEEMAFLIDPIDGFPMRCLPRMRHLMIDMGRYDADALDRMDNLVACLMRFEGPENREVLLRTIDKLHRLVGDNIELKDTLLTWLTAVLFRRSGGVLEFPNLQNFKELEMSLAERMKEWSWLDKQAGRQEGRQEGRQDALETVLVSRFGPLPKDVKARIDVATDGEIAAWLARSAHVASVRDIIAH